MFSQWWFDIRKTMVVEGIKTVIIIVSVLMAMEMHMPTLMEEAYQAVKMCEEKDKWDGS